MNIKQLLAPLLHQKEQALIPTAFDVVGDILIFNQFPDALLKKQKRIGAAILSHFPNIKVIARKSGKYRGELRTPIIRLLAGARRKETIHKENGVRLKLHVENVYFSTRSATERLRIALLVKKKERVLVMFSGIAPFPLVIEKNAHPKEIVGIELNKIAHQYAEQNKQLNKSAISLFQGDVHKVVPKIKGTFSRIIMPLPKNAEHFFALALTKVKKGYVHLYRFAREEELPSIKEQLKTIARQNKKSIRFSKIIKCGQSSPGEFRWCFDISVS